ncbi:MAG: transcription elongation factor GreA [Gammaproteobacteria bacterium]|nr:transcription elongation factor GreA [Gammaproteobacteria bacterium]
MNKVPMTVEGANLLNVELERLKNIERPMIAREIGEARAHGDLRENAEYHAAKERQGLVEARIRDIEAKLGNANIIDISKITTRDQVVFGCTVHLLNIATSVETIFKLVGDDEADYKKNKISIHSPIARALVGKKVDDVVEAKTPAGTVEYEITQIEFI